MDKWTAKIQTARKRKKKFRTQEIGCPFVQLSVQNFKLKI